MIRNPNGDVESTVKKVEYNSGPTKETDNSVLYKRFTCGSKNDNPLDSNKDCGFKLFLYGFDPVPRVNWFNIKKQMGGGIVGTNMALLHAPATGLFLLASGKTD